MPPLKTVFVVVLENHNWSDIEGNTNDAPYINQTLLPAASYCRQYYNPPASHPSLRNYVWMEAGTDFGIPANNTPAAYHQSSTNHLVTQLLAAGISWKSYQEDIDGLTVPLNDVNGYAVRHNPFVYFDDVTGTNNPNWPYGIAHVRPYSELAGDLSSNTVARYNFITPNLCDDGHNSCGPFATVLLQLDTWLSVEVPKIMASAAYSNNGAIFITWDEGVGDDGPIGLIALSPMARGGGYYNNIHYTHSSLLRTLQETFGVGPFAERCRQRHRFERFVHAHSASRAGRCGQTDFNSTSAGMGHGMTNVVEATSDFVMWTPISTNVSVTNQSMIMDPAATNFSQRFYRIRTVR